MHLLSFRPQIWVAIQDAKMLFFAGIDSGTFLKFKAPAYQAPGTDETLGYRQDRGGTIG
jgi:hypothetical protein